jgi:hypothetical protein
LTHRLLPQLSRAAVLVASVFFASSASADVTLVEKDGWTVYMNGRFQTFASYAQGEGRPINLTDANCTPTPVLDPNGVQIGTTQTCNTVELRGGGVERGDGLTEWPLGTNTTTTKDPGKVQELRIRTGFTGNVLGFGIKKQINKDTEVLGYSAVTVGIDSDLRRKFSINHPDWRESFLRISAPWGTVTAGRQLTLFSRGATEITYLYGYRYGLGFPGTVSGAGQSSAGSVGFGVLGNGFGAGFAYATPSLAGVQLTVGVYDANNIVATRILERTRWPQVQSELTYEMKFPSGMFKLFGNGLFQELYDYEGTPRHVHVYGVGYGGRVEVGPVHVGIAGHWGKGSGVTYAMEPHASLYFVEEAQANEGKDAIMRTVDGYYLQAQVSPMKVFDVMAGVGITRVHQLPQDTVAWTDPDMGAFQVPSVGFVTIKQQVGIGAGVTLHASDNLHFQGEYFRPMFTWYKPVPSTAETKNPEQSFDVVNAGVTYDF